MWKAKRERYLDGMGGELELTPRGKHKILHLGAITHRGPPQRTPRGLDVRACVILFELVCVCQCVCCLLFVAVSSI